MSVTASLSEVLGAVFVLIGLSVLNKDYFAGVMGELESNKGLTWILGVITFVMGAITLALYSVWSSDWQVAITIIGWLMLIKGAFITLFPNTSMSFYKKFATYPLVLVSGVLAVVIGLALFYLGYTA